MIENLLLALVLIAQLLIIVYAIGFAIRKRDPNSPLVRTLSQNGFMLAFLAALISTLGSLYYSEIRGFEPCKFCWFQRIFMYPQVILLGVALYKKHYFMKAYGLILSAIGAVIALNHVNLQHTGSSFLPCSANGQSVSCSKVFVIHLGYVTIPAMALTGFVLMFMALLMWKAPQEI
jgi:disulfide bond formation protein DsbB